MANLILASKREVKSGAQMWHAYLQENGTKNAESDFYFSEPMKCLRYMFLCTSRAERSAGERTRSRASRRAERTRKGL